MNILFTGASSFSGMWFIQELSHAGHQLHCIFRQSKEMHQGMRRHRIDRVLANSSATFNVSFGDDAFLSLLSEQQWDLFCHHAAEVTDYKSPLFDPVAALRNNVKNLPKVLEGLKKSGCNKILLTGSVFEQQEGIGSEPLFAVSPYGLSKGLTSEMFSFYANRYGMKLGKFVIANPFGPYEEKRFTSYLVQAWLNHECPSVKTPLYVRDNIPVSLLAKTYAHFASQLNEEAGFTKCCPSFYAESQGSFTRRISHEMHKRFNLPCPFELKDQEDFSEPMVRINTEALDLSQFDWNEKDFWDQFANYYEGNS